MGRNLVDSDWYVTAFGELYPIIYSHRSVEAARPEAEFAGDKLSLCRDDKVLDLCCGTGRHIVHLLQRSPNVVGLDYSPDLLRIAKGNCPNTPLVRADMRHVPLRGGFDVVVSFFTSFGYFPSREENLSVVREVSRLLKPGGRFFIDYFNSEYVIDTLIPASTRTQDGYLIEDERWIDSGARRVNKNTRVSKDKVEIAKFSESVQLYAVDEFSDLLTEGGLMPEAGYGDYAGEGISGDLPRMIMVGRKAGL